MTNARRRRALIEGLPCPAGGDEAQQVCTVASACQALMAGTGLVATVTALASTDERVEIEVTVIQQLDAEVLEPDTLNFETSRAVLATAAQELRALDGSWDRPNMDEVP